MENQKVNRLVPIFASIAIQLCLGTAYIWSIFQNGIAAKLFGGDNAAAALTFSLLLATLTIGSTIGGKLQDKYGPRLIVIIGGVILSIGFFCASFVTNSSPWLLWVTYGLLGGIGMGFTYSTTIACSQKWFPDKRGLITGVIVASLGLGGVIFAPIVEAVIKSFATGQAGDGEQKTFAVLALVFIVVCSIGGFFIKNPPAGFKPQGWEPPAPKAGMAHQDYTPSQVLKMPQFYIVTLALLVACMGGLMMIGFAKPIAIARNLGDVATVGVLVISICNAAGRLFWGWASDRLGRQKTIVILLFGTCILSLFVNVAPGYWIFVLIGLIGFFYGGFLSNFPALTADYWGTKFMATNYGMVLLGFGAGAVISSYIAGYYKNIAKADINLMFPAFVIASLAALAGGLMMLFLKPPALKKEA